MRSVYVLPMIIRNAGKCKSLTIRMSCWLMYYSMLVMLLFICREGRFSKLILVHKSCASAKLQDNATKRG